jgi:hypothetical protein
MSRTHRTLTRLIRRLRPWRDGFAAAAAVYDPSLLIHVRAARR